MKSLELLKKEIEKLTVKNDAAHDFEHIMRVYRNTKKLCKSEEANPKLVLCAALLHDIVSFPKSDKRSKTSSKKSSILAEKILKKYNFSKNEIQIICNAILDHSFSKNKVPKTIEGKILQDADRLDAIGAIGIARAFAVGGHENRSFYNKLDPFCIKRSPDDKKWTLDHFFRKLLLLEKLMNTKSAKIEAKKRTKIIKKYLDDLKREI
ncbi:MAG: HD domain-containing protein [Nitrosopumilaceae archaeon]|nr:HD domain-containing protein [Nitrosopumilaceae archaeon]